MIKVCPLPAVQAAWITVTQMTVCSCSFYTPSTQLNKPPVQLLTQHLAVFPVSVHHTAI